MSKEQAALALASVISTKKNKVSCYITEWEIYWSIADKAYVISKCNDNYDTEVWIKSNSLDEIVNEYLDLTGYSDK